MYKGISRFLQRLGKRITEFGRWHKRPARANSSGANRSEAPSVHTPVMPPHPAEREAARWEQHGPPYSAGFTEEPPWVPLLASDVHALWLGSANYRAQEFLRTTKGKMYSIPNVASLSCAEIALTLKKMGSAAPRDAEWDSRLVYHFTRHYTALRPRFFEN
jgi:hypothetical protein